jgi:hypothetical protein
MYTGDNGDQDFSTIYETFEVLWMRKSMEMPGIQNNGYEHLRHKFKAFVNMMLDEPKAPPFRVTIQIIIGKDANTVNLLYFQLLVLCFSFCFMCLS